MKKTKLPGLLIISLVCGVFGCLGISKAHASQISLALPEKVELNVVPSSNDLSESENEIISVGTDNIGGYNLSIKAKASSDLVNDAKPDSKLESISEGLSQEQYQNGDYKNTWGFKPDYYNGEPNALYRPGPDAIKGVLLVKTTEKTLTNDQYSLAIAAKVDESMPSGQYTNSFVMMASANEIRYTINYDPESLSGATNAEAFTTQTGIISGDSQTINSATPTKDGATFTGWCDRALEEDGTCKGSIIQPGGELRMCDCDTEVTLSAIWDDERVPQYSCPNEVTLCEYNGIKGKRYGNSPCYMSSDAATYAIWSAATSLCSNGWSLPTKTDFNNLVSASQAGNGSCLYEQGWELNGWLDNNDPAKVSSKGTRGLYRSSTLQEGSWHYKLDVNTRSSGVGIGYTNDAYAVRCLHN